MAMKIGSKALGRAPLPQYLPNITQHIIILLIPLPLAMYLMAFIPFKGVITKCGTFYTSSTFIPTYTVGCMATNEAKLYMERTIKYDDVGPQPYSYSLHRQLGQLVSMPTGERY